MKLKVGDYLIDDDGDINRIDGIYGAAYAISIKFKLNNEFEYLGVYTKELIEKSCFIRKITELEALTLDINQREK